MCQLVDMIVDDLTEINQGALMQLEGCLSSDLQSGGVHNTQVTDVEAAISAQDHKLRLPKLLVVCDHEVVAVTLTDLVLSGVAVELDFQVLELLCVNRSKAQGKLVFLAGVGENTECSTGHIQVSTSLGSIQIPRLDATHVNGVKVWLFCQLVELGKLVVSDDLALGSALSGTRGWEANLVTIQERAS